MKQKILVAEDEKDLSKAMKAILEYNGYEVKVVHNGKDAVEKTTEDNYDVILMDIMMPVMDGMEAVKEIRKSGVNTPIMLLTAKSQIDDKVEGLDAGANDYLTKPFNRKELLARIRALARVQNEPKKYNIGNIIFNKESAEISNNKVVLHLNEKECEIMEILINNQERKISTNEINKKVWQTDNDEDSAVTMYMSYLQDKFVALESNIKINNENGYVLEIKV